MVDGGGKATGDQRTGRERSLANLRPYKPGLSGNPSGRPKGPGFYDVLCAHADDVGSLVVSMVTAKGVGGFDPLGPRNSFPPGTIRHDPHTLRPKKPRTVTDDRN